ALEAARRSQEELDKGRRRGPLHGIPIAVKDIFDTRGTVTASGSKLRVGNIPREDSAVVERLKLAGAIIIGKTVTHEFALGDVSPPTRNPWNLGRIPGGSSGGSAAAVAADMCMGALGTDTGGSVR